jgi:hypothetical protein
VLRSTGGVSEGVGEGLSEDKRMSEGKGVCVCLWSSMGHEK